MRNFLFFLGTILFAPLSLATMNEKLVQTENVEQIVLAFVGVILTLIITIAILKKISHFTRFKNGKIKLVAGLSLGVKERVMLLEVKNTHILVSVCPGRVEKIHVFKKEDIQPTEEKGTSIKERTEPFVNVLQKTIAAKEEANHEKLPQKSN